MIRSRAAVSRALIIYTPGRADSLLAVTIVVIVDYGFTSGDNSVMKILRFRSSGCPLFVLSRTRKLVETFLAGRLVYLDNKWHWHVDLFA
jgi:hypothetical protein